MIFFDHVSKQYGKRYALEDITVEIKDGEFVFLIGPSGAGKTSLLRLLLRETVPTKGKVLVDDADIFSFSSKEVYQLRRKIGMVFQDFKLLPDRTVYENVAISLEILGKEQEEIEKDVNKILELVRLTEKSSHFPMQLSAGEMQRTSIARAIVGGPKVLLADEPTGNLDPTTSWEILEILEEINKIGTTIIMATHNATIVNELKKRTISIQNGKIISDELKGKYHVEEKHKDDEEKGERKHHGHI